MKTLQEENLIFKNSDRSSAVSIDKQDSGNRTSQGMLWNCYGNKNFTLSRQ